MQDITIEDDEIYGTLNYVTGYSGFSNVAAEQEGNYLALHVSCNRNDATIKVKLVGSENDEVVLDDDGIVVLRITSNTQSVRVTAETSGTILTKTYSLENVILA